MILNPYVYGGAKIPAMAFKTTWGVSAGQTITLPFFNTSPIEKVYVCWEDGQVTTIEASTDLNSNTITHTYSTAGNKEIYIWSESTTDSVVGKMPCWSTYTTATSRTYLKQINSAMQVVYAGSSRFTNFYSIYYGCTSLTSICSDTLRYNTTITTVQGIFQECSTLQALPTGIFRYNTTINNFVSLCNNCINLSSLPTDLFRYNIYANNFAYCFYCCKNLSSLPTDLFRYNTSATNFSYCFRECYLLLTLPTDLFRYNTSANNFTQTFFYCRKLQLNTSIFCDESSEMATRFAGKTINFTNCFNRDSFTGSQGVAPQLWNYTFGSFTSTTCYAGSGNSATSLSNYSDIPTAWK